MICWSRDVQKRLYIISVMLQLEIGAGNNEALFSQLVPLFTVVHNGTIVLCLACIKDRLKVGHQLLYIYDSSCHANFEKGSNLRLNLSSHDLFCQNTIFRYVMMKLMKLVSDKCLSNQRNNSST